MKKIAILMTTFLRDELMYRTVNSILNNMSEDNILLIADQGNQSTEKEKFYQSLPKEKVLQWYLPYDCGLSYSRNFLVNKAKEMNYKYCLLTADSIELIEPISNLNIIIKFLESNKNYGIVGLKLNNRIKWEKLIRLDEKQSRFILKDATEKLMFGGLYFTRCDITKNFFLAKTNTLYHHKWDNNLKLAEHEDFFWRLKINSFLKVFYTDYYVANYINNKPFEYKKMRQRLYGQFIPLFLKKYNLKYWFKNEN